MELVTYRDMALQASAYRVADDEVLIADIDACRTDALGKAHDEWLAVSALWRKERLDCGCATCLAPFKERKNE